MCLNNGVAIIKAITEEKYMKVKKIRSKLILTTATFTTVLGLSLIGCDNTDAKEPVQPTTSEVVSEEISEIISEEVSEQVSEEISEETIEEQVEEPTIVNDILTLEEAQAHIENLKTIYPDMSEEEIVMLFVNFNIHSLDTDTINYYSSNYDCGGEFANFVSSKIKTIATTGMPGEKEYGETWHLDDFVTNEEVKTFAKEIEDYMNEHAYTMNEKEYYNYQAELDNYMYGTNNIGFTFDYNSPQREDTDLDSICYFIAYYNFIYNKDNIGFSDFVSQEVLYTPVEEYQMENGLVK